MRNVKLRIDPAYLYMYLLLFGSQRIDEIMKRTRKSDVSLEVKVGIQSTIFIIHVLRRTEWWNIFSDTVGLRED